MKLLITGGCGFLGSNLAAHALKRGDTLFIFDNLSRLGASENLDWLKSQGEFQFAQMDIRNYDDVFGTVASFKPDAIFHLAGQVAMTTSIANPRLDFEINAVGTMNLLEVVRIVSPESIVIYSSTNKVYGDLEQFAYRETASRYECVDKPKGFDEKTQLSFHSPYGCSKGTADQYVLDYARIFGLKTIVFRHSSMYGGRQFATEDQGWVGWFCKKSIEIQSGSLAVAFTISGNGKQVRDVLHADDMVNIYYRAVANAEVLKGEVFNVGGGIENSLSLLELFTLLDKTLGITMRYQIIPARESDQRVFIADIGKAKRAFDWYPLVSAQEGIRRMIEWLAQ